MEVVVAILVFTVVFAIFSMLSFKMESVVVFGVGFILSLVATFAVATYFPCGCKNDVCEHSYCHNIKHLYCKVDSEPVSCGAIVAKGYTFYVNGIEVPAENIALEQYSIKVDQEQMKVFLTPRD